MTTTISEAVLSSVSEQLHTPLARTETSSYNRIENKLLAKGKHYCHLLALQPGEPPLNPVEDVNGPWLAFGDSKSSRWGLAPFFHSSLLSSFFQWLLLSSFLGAPGLMAGGGLTGVLEPGEAAEAEAETGGDCLKPEG